VAQLRLGELASKPPVFPSRLGGGSSNMGPPTGLPPVRGAAPTLKPAQMTATPGSIGVAISSLLAGVPPGPTERVHTKTPVTAPSKSASASVEPLCAVDEPLCAVDAPLPPRVFKPVSGSGERPTFDQQLASADQVASHESVAVGEDALHLLTARMEMEDGKGVKEVAFTQPHSEPNREPSDEVAEPLVGSPKKALSKVYHKQPPEYQGTLGVTVADLHPQPVTTMEMETTVINETRDWLNTAGQVMVDGKYWPFWLVNYCFSFRCVHFSSSAH
jgi:hypothetical protein